MNRNPETIWFEGRTVRLDDVLNELRTLRQTCEATDPETKEVLAKAKADEELVPYQAELIQLQEYLEREKRRMIILFEGRDAAGKGGSIRRMTRYMNEKHYRVVALPKPTEEQRTQWYHQKYVAHFPRGGEIVLFDRSWYNRAMVERVFGFF
jgi:polyphosphate kinase 2 (PPK2 family)